MMISGITSPFQYTQPVLAPQSDASESAKIETADSSGSGQSSSNQSQSESQLNKDKQSVANSSSSQPNELTPEQQKVVKQLKQRDAEVRAHEQAHAAVGGQYAGAPSYEYQTGPDGKKYAVGGEVSIDISEESDPKDTIQKMQIVKRAAMAPAEPSAQDYKVAAAATQKEQQARAELNRQSSLGENATSESKENEQDARSPAIQRYNMVSSDSTKSVLSVFA